MSGPPFEDDDNGDEVEYDGPLFRMVPDSLIFDPDLKDFDVRLYAAIVWYARSGRGAWPKRKVIAAKLKKSSTRTLDESYKRLLAKGYLSVQPRYDDDGRRKSNLYRVHAEPLPESKRTAPIRDEKKPRSADVAKNCEDPQAPQDATEDAGDPAENCEGDLAENCGDVLAEICEETSQESAQQGREKKEKGDEEGRENKEAKEEPRPAVGVYSAVGAPGAPATAGKEDHQPSSGKNAAPDPSDRPAVGEVTKVYRAFIGVLPEDIAQTVSRRSPSILKIIRGELGHRTPDELIARAKRRWEAWHYRIEDVNDPVGVAHAVLRRSRDCADVRCEDGHQLDLDAPCKACAASRPDRPARADGDTTAAPAPAPFVPPPALEAPPNPPQARDIIAARKDGPPASPEVVAQAKKAALATRTLTKHGGGR